MINASEVGVAPSEDEVEITLLGPGYGESIVVHIGHGRWIVVDSCINDAGEPQALEYLQAIGVEPENAVSLIVATHWHDDHIRGMAKLVDVCETADFCCAAALRQEEFLAAIHAQNGRSQFAGSSGVREMHTVFSNLRERATRPTFALADRRFFRDETCEIWSLSPSDGEFVRFLESIGTLFPREGETKKRVRDVSPNHVAVVLWIQVKDIIVLLGADLETQGWVRIIESQGRPQERATAFKVPHHGAASAHEPRVWREMLEPGSFAVLTPWRRGGHALPTQEDMRRILAKTEHAYLTSRAAPAARPKRRDRSIERSIREANITIRRISPRWGGVRLRRRMNAATEWSVTRLGEGRHLKELVA